MSLKKNNEKLAYRLIRKFVSSPKTGAVGYKWYASVVRQGHLTREKMGERISARTTVNWVDVNAVLDAMGDEIWDGLRSGEIVEVPPLGNFRLVIVNNGGVANKAEWNPELIRGVRLNYHETGGMRAVTKDIGFVHWSGDAETAVMLVPVELQEAENHLEKAQADLAMAQEESDGSSEALAVISFAERRLASAERNLAELVAQHPEWQEGSEDDDIEPEEDIQVDVRLENEETNK